MMDVWYYIVGHVLPFEWVRHDFMKNALLAAILIAPVFGLLSTMVVNNRMAFFSDSIGHSALTGVALGVLLGVSNPVWSMIIFSGIFSVLIVVVKNMNTESTDTIIGVFSSSAIAVGLVILSQQGFNKFTNYLIGDLLGISPSDIAQLAAVLAGIIVFWILAFNKLLIVSMAPSLAKSRGVRVFFLETAFTIVVAVVVTVSIRWMGMLIINSLLVLPAAAARNIARSIRQYHIASLVTAFVSIISGLILSYYWGTAAGATIVIICAVIFGVSLVYKRCTG